MTGKCTRNMCIDRQAEIASYGKIGKNRQIHLVSEQAGKRFCFVDNYPV